MLRILPRFWLAGGQSSIKSVWPVLVPLNIWHLHKTYIMQLSLSFSLCLRSPCFCLISLSVGSIIHVQFGFSPSFFFFFFLQCSSNHQFANFGVAMLPASWSPFHPAVSIGFVLFNIFLFFFFFF